MAFVYGRGRRRSAELRDIKISTEEVYDPSKSKKFRGSSARKSMRHNMSLILLLKIKVMQDFLSMVFNVSLVGCNIRPFPQDVDVQAHTLIPAEHTRTVIKGYGLTEGIEEKEG